METESAKRAAWQKMTESLTTAAKIYKKFTQGMKIPKGGTPNPVQALALASNLRAKLEAALQEAQPPLSPTDCKVAVVYACRPDSGNLDALDALDALTVQLHAGRENEVLDAMLKCRAIAVAGLIFAIRDRERPRKWMWAYPFSSEDHVLALLNQALDKQEGATGTN